MNLLIEEFKFADVKYDNNVLSITGPINNYGEFTTFLSAYRNQLWNNIPKTTKVVFKNILIEIDDNKFGGDKWAAQWLLEHFDNNLSFNNCWYTCYNRDVGRYVMTNLVSVKDDFNIF
jgi:hypothetical protein